MVAERAIAARALHAARRLHRAGGHRRLQRCRHAGRCPARRAASACIATATGSRRCRRPGGTQAGLCGRRARRAALQRCCHAPRVLLAGASGGFRSLRGAGARARGRSMRWSRTRCCWARSATGSARRRRMAPDPRVRLLGGEPGGARRACRARLRPDRHLRPTSSTRPRPTPTPSPPRRSPPICARSRRAASSRSRSRSASSRPMRCAMLATVRAGAARRRRGRSRRRTSSSTARAWNVRILRRHGAVRRGAHRGGARILRRPLVRRLLLSRHRRRGGAGEHLQRPAGGLLRGGRGRVRRRVGRRGGRRGRAGAARRGDARRGRAFDLRADHARPAVLLLRAAARAARAHPASGSRSCRSRRSGSSSISPCWRRRCCSRRFVLAGAARRPADRGRRAGAGSACRARCSISRRSASASCSSRSS